MEELKVEMTDRQLLLLGISIYNLSGTEKTCHFGHSGLSFKASKLRVCEFGSVINFSLFVIIIIIKDIYLESIDNETNEIGQNGK